MGSVEVLNLKEDTMNMQSGSLKHEFLTVSEIKSFLNISQAKAYELTHRKDFPVCRFGGSIRVPKEAFLMWVKEKSYIPPWMSEAI